ncbi:MAG: DUF1513 domain-containing protein [Pseudomonadota bacterium]
MALCRTKLTRRDLIVGGATVLVAGASKPRAAEARGDEALFAATRRGPDGAYAAAVFRADGADVRAVRLPARGHDVTVCPVTRRVVAFARRPGTFAVAFDPLAPRPPIRFTSPPDRHFYGHGVFSRDGRLLFATENDFEAADGKLGIYDATNGFRRLGEFATGGIGPHDVALGEGGRTLIVANGGIETHPAIGNGRRKLNVADMAPSVVHLDLASGDLISRHTIADAFARVSLRHLAVGAARTSIIGGQLQRGGPADAPIVFRQSAAADGALEPIALPQAIVAGLGGYVSSVATNRAGDIVAVTGARGGVVVYLDVATGRVLDSRSMPDVSGVAADGGDGFLLTSGTGTVARGAPAGAHQTSATRWRWDNHAELLPAGGRS